jgi:hypothetical protein
MFCPAHGVSVCVVCASTTHRQCPHVVSVQARQQEALAELEQLSVTLQDGERALDPPLQQLEDHVKLTMQRVHTAQRDVRDMPATARRCQQSLRSSG